MSYYNYNNVRLKVNGQDLLAESASFAVDASTSYAKTIDKRGGFESVPTDGLRNKVGLSFFLTGIDPFYSSTTSNIGETYSIDAAGLTLQTGHLTSYKFSASPHGPAKVSVDLDFYEDFGGAFSPTILPDEDHGYLRYSDLSMTLAGIDITSKVLSLSYNMSIGANPSFRVGQTTPEEIIYKEKTTSFEVTTYNILETLPYQGKEVQSEMSLGGMTFKVDGLIQSKSLDFSVGTRLTSSLSITQNKYGSAPTITSHDPSSINMNTSQELTIKGTNLNNVTAVHFNNGVRTNKIYNVTDTQFDVTVPRFAITGPYKVITPAGEANSTITINNPIFVP